MELIILGVLGVFLFGGILAAMIGGIWSMFTYDSPQNIKSGKGSYYNSNGTDTSSSYISASSGGGYCGGDGGGCGGGD